VGFRRRDIALISMLCRTHQSLADFGRWGMPMKVEPPSIDNQDRIKSLCNMVIGFINDYPKKISMQEKADGRGGIEIGFVLLKHKVEIASGEQQY